MNYLKSIVLSCLAIALFATCKQDNKTSNNKAINYDDIAVAFCACMKPLVDINIEIKDLLEAGDSEKVQALFPTVQKLSKESETCIGNLENKYGVLTPEQEAKAERAMARACPEVAAMVKAAAQMEQQ